VPTPEKVEAVEDLKERLGGASAVLLTEYRGLTVQQLSDLRKQLRAVSAEYKVVKNRLARIAISASELSAIGPHFRGPTGMIVSRKDPAAVARTLQTFARTAPALAIKAGYIDGQVVGPDGVKALADLPSRDTLRSQIVGAIQGPLAQLVGLLQAPQRELAYILAERGKAAAEAAPDTETKP
jgi:large subunit ribosomal protein L10